MSDGTKYMKPLPLVDEDSQPYWEAARKHQLKLPQCNNCSRYIFYPRVICPHCKSIDLTWRQVKHTGKIYSFTIVRFAITSDYKGDIPYVTALVDLSDGPRIMANILDCSPDEVVIGMNVEMVFQDVTLEHTLPQFRPLVANNKDLL